MKKLHTAKGKWNIVFVVVKGLRILTKQNGLEFLILMRVIIQIPKFKLMILTIKVGFLLVTVALKNTKQTKLI